MSVVNLVAEPLSLVTVNVACGSGAAFGDSDPFVTGPGRIGVTMITPVIPVFSALDSVGAADAQTIRNNKLMATKRRHILLHLVSGKLLFQPIFLTLHSPIEVRRLRPDRVVRFFGQRAWRREHNRAFVALSK